MIYYFIIYSILSFITLYVVTITSYRLDLLDIPDERKIHLKSTAYTGGIALSIIYLFSLELFWVKSGTLNIILSIGFLMAVTGFIDDKYKLNPGGKLSLQIIPIFYLAVIESISLSHIGDYNFFKLELNTFAIPFTLFSILFLINAFNYFDGIDGTLGCSTISVIFILYFLTPGEDYRLFLTIILIPLLIFLCFNFSLFGLPRLFLGDSGSLLLGFIISFYLIYLTNSSGVHPILIAWSVSIFVYEFLSINLIRLKNKKDPFKAGLDHLHHLIFKKTNSIFLTNFSIVIANIIFFIIGYTAFVLINQLTSLVLFIIFFPIFFILRNFLIKKIN